MTVQQKQKGDEVITHECVCMTAPCRTHSTVELETSASHATCTHTHTHSQIQMRRPFHTDGPLAATERVHIASELKRERGGWRVRTLYLLHQSRHPSWMPTETFWQQSNDTRECTILIGSFKKRSEDINEKIRWCNGFWDEKAVCCMDCQRERRLGSGHSGDDYLFTSESVCLAPTLVFLFFFPFSYVHTEGFELIKTCREHKHKYCLFLASL